MHQLTRQRHGGLLFFFSFARLCAPFFFFSCALAGEWDQAMQNTFALQNAGQAVANHSRCSANVLSLMRRQGIATTSASLRELNDTELLQLGMLAAVGGISRWERTKPPQSSGAEATRLVLDDNGSLVHVLSPGAMQNDVMLCVIVSLLSVLLLFHILPTLKL